MADEYKFIVEEQNDGYNAEDFLRINGVSRRLITKLKRIENGITVNGKLLRTIDTVHDGDEVVIKMVNCSLTETINNNIYVPKKYEDESLIIYDKPKGVAVHQSIKHRDDTLANVFAAEYPNLTFRPVNRLDKNTSGLCVCAKDGFTAANLPGSIKKTYYAVCQGVILESGRIDAPIAREKESIIKRVVRDDGQYAVTEYIPLYNDGSNTLLEINLLTGRTHQIRVHFSYIGHPLVGDDLYGGDNSIIQGQALHCGKIEIPDRQIYVKSTDFSDIEKIFENKKIFLEKC